VSASADGVSAADLVGASLIDALDLLGVPLAAGRPTAERALREAGVPFSTHHLAAAVRDRKALCAPTDPAQPDAQPVEEQSEHAQGGAPPYTPAVQPSGPAQPDAYSREQQEP
jgi:hypothetical protein